jgi:hypothetical protein
MSKDHFPASTGPHWPIGPSRPSPCLRVTLSFTAPSDTAAHCTIQLPHAVTGKRKVSEYFPSGTSLAHERHIAASQRHQGVQCPPQSTHELPGPSEVASDAETIPYEQAAQALSAFSQRPKPQVHVLRATLEKYTKRPRTDEKGRFHRTQNCATLKPHSALCLVSLTEALQIGLQQCPRCAGFEPLL